MSSLVFMLALQYEGVPVDALAATVKVSPGSKITESVKLKIRLPVSANCPDQTS